MDNNQLIGIEEAAKYIGMNSMFLRRRCSEKCLLPKPEYYRLGNRLKFKKEDLDAFLLFYKNASASEAREPVNGVAVE
jgi:excisionase family DNA binding protein